MDELKRLDIRGSSSYVNRGEGRVFGHLLLLTWFTFMVQLATERRPMTGL